MIRIPDEKVSVSGMTFVGDDILDDARDILEEPVGVAGDSETERVAKELYRKNKIGHIRTYKLSNHFDL